MPTQVFKPPSSLQTTPLTSLQTQHAVYDTDQAAVHHAVQDTDEAAVHRAVQDRPHRCPAYRPSRCPRHCPQHCPRRCCHCESGAVGSSCSSTEQCCGSNIYTYRCTGHIVCSKRIRAHHHYLPEGKTRAEWYQVVREYALCEERTRATSWKSTSSIQRLYMITVTIQWRPSGEPSRRSNSRCTVRSCLRNWAWRVSRRKSAFWRFTKKRSTWSITTACNST